MEKFSFKIPEPEVVPEKITSDIIEKEILEKNEPEKSEKRGRKPGVKNKAKEEAVPDYVKKMFGPLVVGTHNMLCKILHVSMLDAEQEKIVSEGYAQLLHKRIPNIIEKHGDIIAAIGATAFVLGAKISTETKIIDKFLSFGGNKNADKGKQEEQYNSNNGPERFGQN